MPDADSRYRQYAGLAFIILVYVAGLIGWSWATLTVEPGPAAPDTTRTHVETPPAVSQPVANRETPPAP